MKILSALSMIIFLSAAGVLARGTFVFRNSSSYPIKVATGTDASSLAGATIIGAGNSILGPASVVIELLVAPDLAPVAALESGVPLALTLDYATGEPALQGRFDGGDPFILPPPYDGTGKIEYAFWSFSLDGLYGGWSAVGAGYTPGVGIALPVETFGTGPGQIGGWTLTPLLAEPGAPAQYSYTTNAGGIAITGYSGAGGVVIIPATINGLPVTSLGSNSFSGAGLTSVTIPGSVNTIGSHAFYQCAGLTSATMANGVACIGDHAFAGCAGLAIVAIAGSVTNLGEAAFASCANLTSVFFRGDIPNADSSVFQFDPNATVYCLPGAAGWNYTFAGLPVALWDSLAPHTDYSYTTNDGGITITGYDGPGGALTIPAAITGLPVTDIGTGAFLNVGLTAVRIPPSVTLIGDGAFQSCTSLTNIALFNGLAGIGNSAFNSCASLTGIAIPGSVTSIGDYGFAGCSSLTNAVIPSGVTSIPTAAFNDCSSLTTVAIPAGVTNIGAGAFESCARLTNVAIADGVVSLGAAAFAATSLSDITIPGSVTFIGNNAFESCARLTNATISDGVTSIGASAFSGTALTGIAIPGSVTSIGDNAFAYCASLVTATLSDGLTHLGAFAFAYCGSLTSVTIPGSVASVGGYAFYLCPSLASVMILNGVTSIANDAFYYCAGLNSVTIPGSVTNIGGYAFASCADLAGIYFQGNAPTIGSAVFSGANATIYYVSGTTGWSSPFAGLPAVAGNSLIPVTDLSYTTNAGVITITGYSGPGGALGIPATIAGLRVAGIGSNAFYGASLTGITIPGSVAIIGDGAFYYCASLSNAAIYYGVTSIGAGAFSGTGLTGIMIPATVASIGENAFASCTSLTKAAIADGVASIGAGAFAGTSLADITIPGSVTAIGMGAFASCASLTNAKIDKGVGSIGDHAFYQCTGLISLTIPGSVTNLGDEAFGSCTNLYSVYFRGNAPTVGTAVFAGDNATIYYVSGTTGWSSPFAGLPAEPGNSLIPVSDLSYITNAGAITITGYSGPGGLLTLPATISGLPVTSIGTNAFLRAGLTTLTIPGSVTNVGDGAFASCPYLNSVLFLGDVPAAGSSVFLGDNATVYYLPRTAGWSSKFAGRPAVLLGAVIQTDDASFGARSNQFGFNIIATTNTVVVVEAATDLANPVWLPLQSITLTNGLFYFSEPLQTNSPGRFYRLSPP